MTWKPHVTVAAVIEQHQKFLLVEENVEGRLVLNQPAGHLENDESIVDAVIRETEEETAAIFEPTHITGLYRWKMPDIDRTYIRYSFTGKIVRFIENQPLDTDIIRTVWLSYDEIMQNQSALRSPMVLQCINDYREGQRFPLSLIKDIAND